MADKKNIDYKASAVNLTNPIEIISLMEKYRKEESHIGILSLEIQDCIPQALRDRLEIAEKYHSETNQVIRTAIDQFGSYQDTDVGEYAIKQRRESITYKPELVRCYAPSKVASFVLIESVDTKAMDAMIKTGQITSEQVKQCGETKESFAYIIKSMEVK